MRCYSAHSDNPQCVSSFLAQAFFCKSRGLISGHPPVARDQSTEARLARTRCCCSADWLANRKQISASGWMIEADVRTVLERISRAEVVPADQALRSGTESANESQQTDSPVTQAFVGLVLDESTSALNASRMADPVHSLVLLGASEDLSKATACLRNLEPAMTWSVNGQ